MPKKKKVLRVAGVWDGNAFSILGNTRKYLREAGVSQEKITEVLEKAKQSDYSNLIAVCMDALDEAGYSVR